jgi:cysteine desulfurase
MKRIYLDNAAATPVDAGILKVVTETARKFPANPSALHKEGVVARKVLEDARAEIATAISARPDEIVFTSGATEGNNMALFGVVQVARNHSVQSPHIIVSAIEHPSILEVARVLEREGVRVSYLPVDGRGIVDMKELRTLVTPETVLVSVMYANNEIGTIQPIRDIAKEIRHARKVNNSAYPYFHTDAAQAVNYLDIAVPLLGVDLMTISSGKAYGPRGIGALYIKRGVGIVGGRGGGAPPGARPARGGAAHDGPRRAGTESVALAVGFARALARAEKMKVKESARVEKLRDFLVSKILKNISGTSVNGFLEVGRVMPGGAVKSLPNILNVSFDGIESEALVLYLDAAGIAVSGKSACKSSTGGASHVIMAIGKAGEKEAGAIRFSLGRETRREDIVRVFKELARIIELLRSMNIQSDN